MYKYAGVYSLKMLPSRVILVNNNSFTTLLLASNPFGTKYIIILFLPLYFFY